jgi:photosystem II stability/assembly factor-like uncharacterized protein
MAKAGLLYVGSDDGVLVLSNPAGVGRWLKAGQELRGCLVRALQPAARNALRVTAAAATEGLFRTDDGGQTWHKALDLDVFAIAGHPKTAETIYIGAEGGDVYRSQNEGVVWEQCPQGDHPADVLVTGLLVAPENPDKLYLALEGSGLWSSADRGTTWEPRARGLPPHVSALAASPSQPGRLFASAEGVFYRSDSGDTSWAQFPLPDSSPSQGSALAALAGNQEVLLTTSASGILRSTDQGETWQPTRAEMPWEGAVNVLSPASYHPDTVFAGTRGGQLALSSDRGRTWQLIASGLPAIYSLAAIRLA